MTAITIILFFKDFDYNCGSYFHNYSRNMRILVNLYFVCLCLCFVRRKYRTKKFKTKKKSKCNVNFTSKTVRSYWLFPSVHAIVVF